MMMQSDVFELQAEICKVMANPKRIRIIALLKDQEKSVTEIAESLGISQSNTSQHLMIMKAKGVVKSRRVGREIRYSIAVPELSLACEFVGRALEKIVAGTPTVE
ncbi:MAG: ArsR/SmtB family transcription factor [Candidatus Odinarchaeota archaeon]